MSPTEAELLKTRITFVGADYWTAHLAEGLNSRYHNTVSCSAIRLRDNRAAVPQAAWHLMRDAVIVRVGFPPPTLPAYDEAEFAQRTGPRERIKRVLFRSALGRGLRRIVLFLRLDVAGRSKLAIDWMQRLSRGLRPKRRDFIYWIGSDVTTTLVAWASGSRTVSRTALGHYCHMSVAPHLVEELNPIVAVNSLVHFPKPIPRTPDPLPPLPGRFTVLTYLPNGRFEFYGGAEVLETARRLPEVRFRVIGGQQPVDRESTDNVEFVGYVTDREEVYADCSVFVRLTEHDGSPSTVAEALAFGRYVVYSFPHPHCIWVQFGDVGGLMAALQGLSRQHRSGVLHPNQDAASWALSEYDPDRCFAQLMSHLT